MDEFLQNEQKIIKGIAYVALLIHCIVVVASSKIVNDDFSVPTAESFVLSLDVEFAEK